MEGKELNMDRRKVTPCPFCGNTYIRVQNGENCAWVVCVGSGCGAKGPIAVSEQAAVDAWNERASLT